MCTYIIYPISCCWSCCCCCKSMVWEVSNGIVIYLLAEGAEKVGIQRAIASGARPESLLPWARCLTGAYFLGSKKCKGCRPWMAMTNQTTNCKNEKIQCNTGCTKIAHSPYEEIMNTWCFLNTKILKWPMLCLIEESVARAHKRDNFDQFCLTRSGKHLWAAMSPQQLLESCSHLQINSTPLLRCLSTWHSKETWVRVCTQGNQATVRVFGLVNEARSCATS